MNKLEIFKKKLLYRSNYRGTKEMDILLSEFVRKYINEFTEEQLNDLDKFLDFEDEIIMSNGGEGGIRTHERVAPLLVFKTSAFNRSATSPRSK